MKKSKVMIALFIAIFVGVLQILANASNADTPTPSVTPVDTGTSNILYTESPDTRIEITEVNVTLVAPIIGNKVLPVGWDGTEEEINCDLLEGYESDIHPFATVSTSHISIGGTDWVNKLISDGEPDYDQPFFGTFKANTDYYASIHIEAEDGYKLGAGLKIKVNGQDPVEVYGLYNDGESTRFIAKIRAEEPKLINKINLSVALPKIGTTIEETTEPIITVENGVNYKVSYTMFINNYPSKDEKYDDGSILGKKIEEGKDYYFEVFLEPINGYTFDDKENVTLTINGKTDYEIGYCSPEQFGIYSKVTAEKVLYKVLEGENQKVNLSKKLELILRFNIEYADFLATGKVYVDNVFCNSKNYDSKEGSTVISFKPEYLKTLSEGKHNVIVTVANGEATTDFTIVKSINPATGDNIVVFAVIAAVAVVGFATITIISTRRKSNKK